MEEIEAGGAAAIVCRVWAAHYGQQSKHVQWDWRDAAMLGGPGGGSEEALAEIKGLCGALGPAACAGICGVYAQSYDTWAGGLPDLLVWRRPEAEEGGGGEWVARFVEVKGPGDSLSNRQRAWIDKLLAWKVAVTVCHVVAV